jgi:hypothetical protein
MISSRLAEGLLLVIVLGSLAGVAFQSPLLPGQEGAMFVDAVLEQPTVAAEPDGFGPEARAGLLGSDVATAKSQE